jgi:hypothetical protein
MVYEVWPKMGLPTPISPYALEALSICMIGADFFVIFLKKVYDLAA